MSQAEIEAILQAMFLQCEQQFVPLSEVQKQILQQTLAAKLSELSLVFEGNNPLNELTEPQRKAFLNFVKDQERKQLSWKATLLDDWFQNRSSGQVQFIREEYGSSWLSRLQQKHLEQYLQAEKKEQEELEIGDRIEVCNALWEWVQDEGPCSRQWFSCSVVGISEAADQYCSYTNCIVRFDNGREFEIQGIYQWNRPNWRYYRSWEK